MQDVYHPFLGLSPAGVSDQVIQAVGPEVAPRVACVLPGLAVIDRLDDKVGKPSAPRGSRYLTLPSP